MSKIIIADKTQYAAQIREIFWEYLVWVNARIFEEFGVKFDITAILEEDMKDLNKFMPPKGRLLIGYAPDDPSLERDHPVGIACLKELESSVGEIKRMYVRPEYRKKGLGQAFIEKLFAEAAQIGYQMVRLDSARFMTGAHRLYRKAGFREINPYAGSEIPAEFQKNWVFMEKSLI